MAESTQTQPKPTAENSGQRDPQGKLIGANGQALPNQGEHAGGSIKDELKPDPPADATTDPLWKQRRYMKSALAQQAGMLIARSPENIGLWGKGDTYRGTGILVNVDTLEKVRVYAEYKFEGDEVFANSRDLPPSLVDGDVTKNLSGKS